MDASKIDSPDSTSQETSKDVSPELRAYLDAPFEVRLLEKAGRFTLSIPEMGLLEHGKSVELAYAKLVQAREQRIREYASEDLLAWLPRPDAGGNAQAKSAEPRLLTRLRPFLIKAAVTAAMLMWAMNMINGSIRDIGYRLEKNLDGLANWSPETVELQRARSAKVAEKLGPIIRELLVMFHDPAVPAGTAAAGGADALQKAGSQNATAPAPGELQ